MSDDWDDGVCTVPSSQSQFSSMVMYHLYLKYPILHELLNCLNYVEVKVVPI